MDDDATMKERVLQVIHSFPGIHLRGLVRQLDTTTSLARYHIQSLVAEGAIRATDVGGFTRYFPAAEFQELTARERKELHLLRQERPLEIVLALLEFGAMQHRDLLEIVGGSKGTLTYQLGKLTKAGLVRRVATGVDRGFHLVDADRMRGLLARYEPIPEVLGRVHDTWDDLFGGHKRGSE